MEDLDQVVAADAARPPRSRCPDLACQSFTFDTEAEMRQHVAAGAHVYAAPAMVDYAPASAIATVTITDAPGRVWHPFAALRHFFGTVFGWMTLFAIIGCGHVVVLGGYHAFGGH